MEPGNRVARCFVLFFNSLSQLLVPKNDGAFIRVIQDKFLLKLCSSVEFPLSCVTQLPCSG